jgi:beta-glucanase (GH16 family)
MKKKLVSSLASVVVLAALAAGPAAPCAHAAAVNAPVQALRAGINNLKFQDDFISASTIDLAGTGNAGFKWYLDRPFGWAAASASEVSVANSILTVKSKPNAHAAGWGLSTYSVIGDTGYHFQYGYAEAKIRFNHKGQRTNNERDYFPCFWSFSKDHTMMRDGGRWGEIDIFEAYTDQSDPLYRGQYVGTVHDHANGGVHTQNGNHWKDNVIKDSSWHTYGMLWEKGKISWYFDNQLMHSVEYSADGYPKPMRTGYKPGTFSILDNESMVLVLGGSESWPLEVDYVRVWEKGGPVVSISDDTTTTRAQTVATTSQAVTTRANQPTNNSTINAPADNNVRRKLEALTTSLKVQYAQQGNLADDDWRSLTAALDEAQAVLDDNAADISRLKAALDSLENLQTMLESGGTDTALENVTETSAKPMDKNLNDEPGNVSSPWVIIVIVVAVLSLAGGVVMLYFKLRKSGHTAV